MKVILKSVSGPVFSWAHTDTTSDQPINSLLWGVKRGQLVADTVKRPFKVNTRECSVSIELFRLEPRWRSGEDFLFTVINELSGPDRRVYEWIFEFVVQVCDETNIVVSSLMPACFLLQDPSLLENRVTLHHVKAGSVVARQGDQVSSRRRFFIATLPCCSLCWGLMLPCGWSFYLLLTSRVRGFNVVDDLTTLQPCVLLTGSEHPVCDFWSPPRLPADDRPRRRDATVRDTPGRARRSPRRPHRGAAHIHRPSPERLQLPVHFQNALLRVSCTNTLETRNLLVYLFVFILFVFYVKSKKTTRRTKCVLEESVECKMWKPPVNNILIVFLGYRNTWKAQCVEDRNKKRI